MRGISNIHIYIHPNIHRYTQTYRHGCGTPPHGYKSPCPPPTGVAGTYIHPYMERCVAVMHGRAKWWTEMWLSPSFSLSLSPSRLFPSLYFYLSVCLSVDLLLTTYLHLHLYLSCCLSIYLFIYLSIYPSVCLSIDQSTYQSIYLSTYLSTC